MTLTELFERRAARPAATATPDHYYTALFAGRADGRDQWAAFRCGYDGRTAPRQCSRWFPDQVDAVRAAAELAAAGGAIT